MNTPKSSLVYNNSNSYLYDTKYMQTNSKREAIKFEGKRVIRECALLNISQNTNKKYKSHISFDISILEYGYVYIVQVAACIPS